MLFAALIATIVVLLLIVSGIIPVSANVRRFAGAALRLAFTALRFMRRRF